MKQKLLIIGDSKPSKNSETSSFDNLIAHPLMHKVDAKFVNYSTITDGEIPYIDGHFYVLLLFPYSYWSQHIERESDGVLYGDEHYGMMFENYMDKIDDIIKAKYKNFTYVNSPNSIKIDRDKKLTKDILSSKGISVPPGWTIEKPDADLEVLRDQIDLGNNFYIKPRFGAMGKGITYLSKHKAVSNYENGNGLRAGFDYGWSFQKIAKKGGLLKRIVDSKPILEKEIKTPLIKKRKFDLRIYVIYGRVPYLYARSAPIRKPITNWSQGGRIEKEVFLKHIPSHKLRCIKQIAKKSAEALALNFCGVDVIFDEQWTPYVLEAQSMPSWESGYDLFGMLIKKLAAGKAG